MKRKIVRIGNSYGIIIPKTILRLLEWDVKELDVEIDLLQKRMVIKKRP